MKNIIQVAGAVLWAIIEMACGHSPVAPVANYTPPAAPAPFTLGGSYTLTLQHPLQGFIGSGQNLFAFVLDGTLTPTSDGNLIFDNAKDSDLSMSLTLSGRNLIGTVISNKSIFLPTTYGLPSFEWVAISGSPGYFNVALNNLSRATPAGITGSMTPDGTGATGEFVGYLIALGPYDLDYAYAEPPARAFTWSLSKK